MYWPKVVLRKNSTCLKFNAKKENILYQSLYIRKLDFSEYKILDIIRTNVEVEVEVEIDIYIKG